MALKHMLKKEGREEFTLEKKLQLGYIRIINLCLSSLRVLLHLHSNGRNKWLWKTAALLTQWQRTEFRDGNYWKCEGKSLKVRVVKVVRPQIWWLIVQILFGLLKYAWGKKRRVRHLEDRGFTRWALWIWWFFLREYFPTMCNLGSRNLKTYWFQKSEYRAWDWNYSWKLKRSLQKQGNCR